MPTEQQQHQRHLRMRQRGFLVMDITNDNWSHPSLNDVFSNLMSVSNSLKSAKRPMLETFINGKLFKMLSQASPTLDLRGSFHHTNRPKWTYEIHNASPTPHQLQANEILGIAQPVKPVQLFLLDNTIDHPAGIDSLEQKRVTEEDKRFVKIKANILGQSKQVPPNLL